VLFCGCETRVPHSLIEYLQSMEVLATKTSTALACVKTQVECLPSDRCHRKPALPSRPPVTALLPTTDGSFDPHVTSITISLTCQLETLMLHSATSATQQTRHMRPPVFTGCPSALSSTILACTAKSRLVRVRTALPCTERRRCRPRRSVFEPSLEPPHRLPANCLLRPHSQS